MQLNKNDHYNLIILSKETLKVDISPWTGVTSVKSAKKCLVNLQNIFPVATLLFCWRSDYNINLGRHYGSLASIRLQPPNAVNKKSLDAHAEAWETDERIQ